MRTLEGKTIVITGAGSGIGRALALQMATKGVKRLLLNDYKVDPLGDTLAAVLAKGCKAEAYPFDVSERGAMFGFAAEVMAQGPVDAVINNAGVAMGLVKVADVPIEDMEWLMGINLWGVIYGTKAFLPHLLKRPEAHIVNISSVFGLAGIPGQATYCTAKFAVRGFTESLRQELAGSPVRVTCVHPGGVATNIVRDSRHYGSAERQRKFAERFKASAKTTPESAAAQIIAAMLADKPRLLIGQDARLMDRLARLFPSRYEAYFKKWL